MSSVCDQPLAPCPIYDTTRDLTSQGYNTLTHRNRRNFLLTLDKVVIPAQVRTRDFSIHYDESSTWTDLKIVVGTDGMAEDCGTKSGTSGATISEDATFTDSELYYVDHLNGVALWREWTEACKFAYTAQKTATFKQAYGTFYAHWFEVYPVIQQTEKWYLLVNGVKEEVDAWSGSVKLPLINLLWPMPPALGTPGENNPTEFYDYNSDEELKRLDGGMDFYYPSWLRSMGLNRAVDQEEAEDRYNSYFYHDARPATASMKFPSLGYADPVGNAVKDGEGNILVSFQTRNKVINRLYLADGSLINLATSDKLYPVGLI